jgi:hypothetical protein
MADLDKPPPMLLQRCLGGWRPYGSHSPAMEVALPIGQVVTATPRRGRTIPRNAAYWAGLQNAVAATESWPTAGHLHEDLKRLCGYVDYYYNALSKREETRTQSTSFGSMSEPEFALYFRMAQMRFAQQMGFDPWEKEAFGWQP